MPISKNLELDVANYEDLCHLAELGTKADRSNANLRHTSHIVRRLLLQGDLNRSTGPRNIKLLLTSPDNKALVRAAQNKRVRFWQSGGADVFGVWFRAPMIMNASEPVDLGNWNAEALIELKLDSFLSQPVFYLDGLFATRKDVINYVANKAAGAHFDSNREDVYEMLGKCRSAIHFRLIDGNPAFDVDIFKFQPLDDTYLPPPDSIDPVFFEFYAACHYISHSSVIKELMESLRKELGRSEPSQPAFSAGHAPKRTPPNWTPYRKLDMSAFVPPNAVSSEIQYRLWSNDMSIPLMIRFATDDAGSCMRELSGLSGTFEERINPQIIYISLAHPSIEYDVSVRGYQVGNGDW
jgi:hypothetical protein